MMSLSRLHHHKRKKHCHHNSMAMTIRIKTERLPILHPGFPAYNDTNTASRKSLWTHICRKQTARKRKKNSIICMCVSSFFKRKKRGKVGPFAYLFGHSTTEC